MRSQPRGVAVPDANPAAEEQCLGTCPRLGEATLDEQLVEPLASRAAGRDRLGAHAGIVAQPASRRLIGAGPPMRSRRSAAARSARSGSRMLAGRRDSGRAEPERRERLADLRRDPGGVEAQEPAQVRDGAVIDEPVGRDAR